MKFPVTMLQKPKTRFGTVDRLLFASIRLLITALLLFFIAFRMGEKAFLQVRHLVARFAKPGQLLLGGQVGRKLAGFRMRFPKNHK